MKHFAVTITAVAMFAMSGLVPAIAADDLAAALQNPDRAEADKVRDAGRKPAEVIGFLGFGEGTVVIDFMASSGYYTEVLSYAVGATGTVYSQNTAGGLAFRDGAADKALTERLANNRLANVIRLDNEIDGIELDPGTLDAAFTALNFHDIHNANPEYGVAFLKVARALLKPGGILGVVDHAGVAGADNSALHRVDVESVRKAAVEAGFEIVAESDILANPDDDGTGTVFGAEMRGNTNRFLLKLRNPD